MSKASLIISGASRSYILLLSVIRLSSRVTSSVLSEHIIAESWKMDIYPGPGVRKGAIYNEVSHGIIRHYIELIRELKIGNRLSGRRREQTRMRYPARQITAVVYLRKFKKKNKN